MEEGEDYGDDAQDEMKRLKRHRDKYDKTTQALRLVRCLFKIGYLAEIAGDLETSLK